MYSNLSWSALLAFALGLVGTFVVVKFMQSEDNVDEDIAIFKDDLKYVDIRGKRLRLLFVPCQRSKSDSLMVFVHGLGGQIAHWEHQAHYFSNIMNVLAVEFVGAGKSEVSRRPEDYEILSLVEDLRQFIEQQPYNRLILIGHSFGQSYRIKNYGL